MLDLAEKYANFVWKLHHPPNNLHLRSTCTMLRAVALEIRRRFGKLQINLHLRSTCTNFAHESKS